MPFLMPRFLSTIYRHVITATWPALLVLVTAHAAVGWALLALAGEEKVADLESFIYFYVVTATTVGYGDISPATAAGRAVVILWIMPGGIALFTTIITKLVATIAGKASARMNGNGDFSHMKQHLVVLGWQPGRTCRLIELFLSDRRYNHDGIVLIDRHLDRNPLPDSIRYVRSELPCSPDAFRRSGLLDSEVIVVIGADDNETLANSLAVAAATERHVARNGGVPPRIVAHFADDTLAAILRSHCPTAEVSVSLALEMMVRSAQDPGSSEVQRQILSPEDSPSQYCIEVPRDVQPFPYGKAFIALKEQVDATLMGWKGRTGRVTVNPPSPTLVQPGDVLYVVSEQRILPNEVRWDAIA
jgi:voltage-gated potassium channel